jgi:hypothetical protein
MYGTWIDAGSSFAHFLIACKSFQEGGGGWITLSCNIPTQDIPIPQTDSTKPISRLKRM